MADFEGFHLDMEPIESMRVVDLSTGEDVSRPEIAQKAAGLFIGAIESTGATASVRRLHVVGEEPTESHPDEEL